MKPINDQYNSICFMMNNKDNYRFFSFGTDKLVFYSKSEYSNFITKYVPIICK